ncbi:MAG: hypothetical protein N0C84_00500 [Candidatus Thiodiazotropha taylori]|uniref:Secreted protein n=1 Tax=Candidatus Thiodiazotropha taylori TaxID=2792791 RepID=A0A9E4K952_9GAMM|nr:hypothetical protein [Candidatus Thiodiazotropha taylori]MCW4254924.1 hypothetical protein [Candidatus Thiodiazotropha taylori]
MKRFIIPLMLVAATTASAESIRTSDGVQCVTNDKGWGKAYGEVETTDKDYGLNSYSDSQTTVKIGFEVPLGQQPSQLDCTKLLKLEERRLELELLAKVKELELMDAQIQQIKQSSSGDTPQGSSLSVNDDPQDLFN